MTDMSEEERLLNTIDRAISNLARTYKFGYYDIEDMMQEGRIFALEAVPLYDPSRNCSLEQFLRVHVRNKFINLRRDKMERKEPPCKNCVHMHDDLDSCSIHSDQTECDRWSGWIKRNIAKKTLVETYENDKTLCDSHHDISSGMMCKELLELMEKEFPLSLKSDYRRYLEDVPLPKQRKIRIEEEIRSIVKESYGEVV